MLTMGWLALVVAQGCEPTEPEEPAGSAGAAGQAGSGGGAPGGAGGSGGGETSPSIAFCSGTSKTCKRPVDVAMSAPYTGLSGALGCAVNARCTLAVGESQGVCEAQGCKAAPPDPKVPAKINGTTQCNAPLDFTFEGLASEAYLFGVTFSAKTSANVGATLLLDGEPVVESLNPVDITGSIAPDQPYSGERWYSLRKSGTYTLRFSVLQCDEPITVSAFVDRKSEAAPNLTHETARAIASGNSTTGTLNCEEERWFVLAPQAGQALRFSLAGSILQPGMTGAAELAFLDAARQPLNDGANDIALVADFPQGTAPAPSSLDVTFPSGGVHYLRLRHWNACAIGTYTLSVASP